MWISVCEWAVISVTLHTANSFTFLAIVKSLERVFFPPNVKPFHTWMNNWTTLQEISVHNPDHHTNHNFSHPSHSIFFSLRLGRRYKSKKACSTTFKYSFFLTALRLFMDHSYVKDIFLIFQSTLMRSLHFFKLHRFCSCDNVFDIYLPSGVHMYG